MNPTLLKIPKLLRTVKECWVQSEEKLQCEISQYSPNINEEEITQRFHCFFAKTLTVANRKNLIKDAFKSDLKDAYPNMLSFVDLSKLAEGLTAEVTLHNKLTEGKTGGDIGFVIERPSFKKTTSSSITGFSCRFGLLTQAKLKNKNGKWGNLTPKQKTNLPKRLKFLCLLLYHYRNLTRNLLNPFGWQLCENCSIEQISNWLANGCFPSLKSSSEIIDLLANGSIGTDNQDLINNYISPGKNRCMVLKVYWPDDKHNPPTVKVYSSEEQREQAIIHVLNDVHP